MLLVGYLIAFKKHIDQTNVTLSKDLFCNLIAVVFVICTVGCSDDTRNMQYSLGQEFMTSNCCQCLCGNGGNISCNMATCRSMARCELSTSESGSDPCSSG